MNSRSSLLLPLAISVLCAVLPVRGAKPAEKWETLFNGKNLDGWYIFLQKSERNQDPQKVITVENGVIHAYKSHRSGATVPMGYIGTERSFADYHLRVKYKWGRKQFEPRYIKKPDGGIYYHHAGPDFVWPQALQFISTSYRFTTGSGTGAIHVPKGRREARDFKAGLPARSV